MLVTNSCPFVLCCDSVLASVGREGHTAKCCPESHCDLLSGSRIKWLYCPWDSCQGGLCQESLIESGSANHSIADNVPIDLLSWRIGNVAMVASLSTAVCHGPGVENCEIPRPLSVIHPSLLSLSSQVWAIQADNSMVLKQCPYHVIYMHSYWNT